MSEQQRSIAVIGVGLMGLVIASLYASRNYRVTVCARQSSTLDTFEIRALPYATAILGSEEEAKRCIAQVRKTTSLEKAIVDVSLVQEAIQEDLTLKRDLFEKLDALCGPDVILATNTSSYLLADICEKVLHKDRVIGIHYVMPAHIIKAVEVIHADFTRPGLVEAARSTLEDIGLSPVACLERPGFLINRLQYALLAEAYRILDEGFASVEDIDTAIRLSIGPRLALWGPLMTQDLVASKATSLAALTYMYEQTGEQNLRPRAVLKQMVAQGFNGAAAGRGWYDWSSTPYSTVVERRDERLSELLNWLEQRQAHQSMGASRAEALSISKT